MIHIFSGSSGIKEITRLAKVLTDRYGIQSGAGSRIPTGTTLVVSWGYPISWPCVLNAKAGGHSKYNELQMLTAHRVACPEVTTTKPSAGDWVPRAWSHYGGLDIAKYLNGEGGTPAYWTRFVKTEQEYRVHVFMGEAFLWAKKVKAKSNAHPWIHSSHFGWDYDYYATCPERGKVEAAKAVAAVGYDFGAVDVGITINGDPIVFEVNSAPGIGPQSQVAYAAKISAHYATLERG